MSVQVKRSGSLPEPSAGSSLGELLGELSGLEPSLTGDPETRVRRVTHDSRQVLPGDLFVARSGARADGARFVSEAIARGATAIIAERGAVLANPAVPVVRVGDARLALARVAEAVAGFPSRLLPVVGVTGTNGKTTTTVLLQTALEALGQRPARLGTLGFSFGKVEEEGTHTTPEADDLSQKLAEVVRLGATHFLMEVSSHALELQRVAALSFEVAAFSNLTQDHLDFHGSMAAYAESKARLFTEFSPRVSVINCDDAFGRTLRGRARGRVIAVGRGLDSDLRVGSQTIDQRGILATIEFEGHSFELQSSLIGAHNLDNLLLALGVLVGLGQPPADAASALGHASGVPGRLERCDQPGDDCLVVVDYAHTPDALERVLDALRAVSQGRLICVFGCGGDRDPGKRPLMGRAVAARADVAILTNDNPRTEPPERIVQAVLPALVDSGVSHRVELDRARAIELAIGEARPHDTVLIAGKGHETYQIFGTEKLPFDDREQARQALSLRRKSGNR